MEFKNELYKKKRYLTARDNNKIVSRKRYSKKTYNDDIKTFKKNNTFKENVTQTKLVNVREKKTLIFDSINDKRYKVSNPTRYQYGFKGLTAAGIEIHARSQLHPKNHPQESARREALENFYYRISFEYSKNTKYDASEGKNAFDNGFVVSLEEYIVNYVKR